MCMNVVNIFGHAQLYTNDYFVPNSFPILFCKVGLFSCYLDSFARTIDEVENPWCLSSNCDFLVVLRSNFEISPSTPRSPTRE